MKNSYEGEPLDLTNQYITETTESDILEVSSDQQYNGQQITKDKLKYFSKGQKIAVISINKGIKEVEEMNKYINKKNMDISKSYIYQILNGHKEVEGFKHTKNGLKQVENDEQKQRIDPKVKNQIVRIGRLNPDYTYKEIKREYEKAHGKQINYNTVRYILQSNNVRDKQERGSKKKAIIKIHNKTGLTGKDLSDKVNEQTNYNVSNQYISVLAQRGYIDKVNNTKTDQEIKQNILKPIKNMKQKNNSEQLRILEKILNDMLEQ